MSLNGSGGSMSTLANKTDSSFVRYLNDFITNELVLIEACNTNTKEKDRFLVFRNAFSKVNLKKTFKQNNYIS